MLEIRRAVILPVLGRGGEPGQPQQKKQNRQAIANLSPPVTRDRCWRKPLTLRKRLVVLGVKFHFACADQPGPIPGLPIIMLVGFRIQAPRCQCISYLAPEPSPVRFVVGASSFERKIFPAWDRIRRSIWHSERCPDHMDQPPGSGSLGSRFS
jgi:hypothetical protein